MGRKPSPQTPEERAVENARYQTLNWRAEAKLLTDADYPTADQILQIHAICRTLDLDLPTAAFRTASAAAHWLLTQESQIGDRELRKPKVRQIPLG